MLTRRHAKFVAYFRLQFELLHTHLWDNKRKCTNVEWTYSVEAYMQVSFWLNTKLSVSKTFWSLVPLEWTANAYRCFSSCDEIPRSMLTTIMWMLLMKAKTNTNWLQGRKAKYYYNEMFESRWTFMSTKSCCPSGSRYYGSGCQADVSPWYFILQIFTYNQILLCYWNTSDSRRRK